MHPNLIIAIDGHSSCGKSTLARGLAQKLNYRYIDTGAMYRAVTYFFNQNRIDITDNQKILDALKEIKIDFFYTADTGTQNIILNGENIDGEIRKPEVANRVSEISTIKTVRVFLVSQQQEIGKDKCIVMDGRDIGTVVFPNADIKFYLTASEEIRAKRRFEELKTLGQEWKFEDVLKNIHDRDVLDSSRKESPLRRAEDAILLDNSNLTIKEQLDFALEVISKKQALLKAEI